MSSKKKPAQRELFPAAKEVLGGEASLACNAETLPSSTTDEVNIAADIDSVEFIPAEKVVKFEGANIADIIEMTGAHHIEIRGELIVVHVKSNTFNLRLGDSVKHNADGSISITSTYRLTL